MKTLFYSTRSYDRESMLAVNSNQHDLQFTEARLDKQTVKLAQGYAAVCGFVNDGFDASLLQTLADGGTRLVLLRSTGFNNVDLKAAAEYGITVMRVGNYSPYSVAEISLGKSFRMISLHACLVFPTYW